MTLRVLLTSAGNAPSNNLVRSLRAGLESVFIAGCHDDPFVLRNANVDTRVLVPPVAHPRWTHALQHAVETERIQVIIPTTDADVAILSRYRRRFEGHLLLPRQSIIARCQDKYCLHIFLRDRGIPVAVTREVEDLKAIPGIFRELASTGPLWCRVRSGAGSLGALRVRTPAQARSWIRYWVEMRDMTPRSFLLSEYLPGRDFGCQSLWKDGELILMKTYERLSYLVTGQQPTEISSIAALAKTVIEPDVAQTCKKAIRLLDRKVSGVFCVDLKQSARGIPCITEINAGRFSSATNIVDLVGVHNMAAAFVQLAAGSPPPFRDLYDATDDWYMLRDIDSRPNLFHARKFFDNIRTLDQS